MHESTVGLVFFGTPHRGSQIASYGKILSNIGGVVLSRPSSKLLNALESDRESLLRLESEFMRYLPKYNIVSFYESIPIPPFKHLISPDFFPFIGVVD
jgi:hypothetical protein